MPKIPECTFLGTSNGLARFVFRPVRRFMAIEAASGAILLVATVAALVWANSPWADSYTSFWHTELELVVGSFHLGGEAHPFTLEAFVNDALMAVFFFVVGLEIKRELVAGQLRDPKAAALPAVAAVGGMVVPALFYVVINANSGAAGGWGIPMATDIAFAVGVMALLGRRIPRALRVFLLTLAIVDDIGAILVIAFFYTESISRGWLALAGALIVAVVVLRLLRVWYIPVYIVVGVALWLATFESGLHATIAGVVLGLLTPAKPIQSSAAAREWADWLRDKGDELFSVDVRFAAFHIKESVSVAERLESMLHPIAGFVIIPVFALANAGVPLGGGVIGDAAGSAVTWGVVCGLVLGKAIGVFGFTMIAARVGIGRLPKGVTAPQVFGVASLAGVGFTVSLFVTSLAFTDPAFVDQAKIGILGASAVAAVCGVVLLWWSTRHGHDEDEPGHDGHEVPDRSDDVDALLGSRQPVGVG